MNQIGLPRHFAFAGGEKAWKLHRRMPCLSGIRMQDSFETMQNLDQARCRYRSETGDVKLHKRPFSNSPAPVSWHQILATCKARHVKGVRRSAELGSRFHGGCCFDSTGTKSTHQGGCPRIRSKAFISAAKSSRPYRPPCVVSGTSIRWDLSQMRSIIATIVILGSDFNALLK